MHEYHFGFAGLAVLPAATADASPHLSPGELIAAVAGLWLVVKDWPDLFKATRDKASWRLGLHRLPPGEARAIATRFRSNAARRLRVRRRPPSSKGGTMSRVPLKRQRRSVVVTWAIVALVGFAALATASAAAAITGAIDTQGTPDAVLLRTYQPVLVFHPREPFRPTKVESFVADSELEQFVGTSPLQLPHDAFWRVVDPDPEPGELPPGTPGVVYRLDQIGCEADSALAGEDCYADAWAIGSGGAAVYGRVIHTETRIVLQYWLFYYDNPLVLPSTPVGTFWQSHEGDWEVVNVVLGLDGEPIEAAYSQHCSGQRKAWAGVTKSSVGDTHPIAYVALGSHANYFAPGAGALGAAQINPACIPAFLPPLPFAVVDQVLDGAGDGAVVGPPGSGFDAATIHRIEGTAWSVFGGRWGESEYFFTPIAFPPSVPANTAVPVGLAPASPANQANWNAQTILGWPLAP